MNRLTGIVFYVVIMALITACSGGDDGGDVIGTGENATVRGTAAVGKAIANTNVELRASGGQLVTARSGANGKFELGVNGLAGPFLLRTRANGRHLFSVAAKQGIANIHPFTDLIIRNWFRVQGLDIETEFDNGNGATMLPSPEDIGKIELAIRHLIAQTLLEYSINSATLNLISHEFDANGSGFDGFLDYSNVIIVNNSITIVIQNPQGNAVNEIVSGIGLDTDLRVLDEMDPDQPMGVRAVPASDSEIIVVWEPTSDNVGVAGYKLYRDGSLIATTPYPVFTDAGLLANTEYCYTVVAFDGENNESAASASNAQACSMVDGSADTTKPSVPLNLQATVSGSDSISLTWTPSQDSDVVAYHLYRGTSGTVGGKAATTIASSYLDSSLSAATEYCYEVTAMDAANNESDRSNRVCVTTDAGTQPPDVGVASCDTPQLLSDNIVVDTTLSGCYRVTSRIYVQNNATLSIAPGSTLLFDNNTGLNIRSDGALSAVGTSSAPILMSTNNKTPGAWEGLQFTFSNFVTNELDYVTIEYGGGGQNNGDANLVMYGSGTLTNRIKIRNSTFRYSYGYGFEFDTASIVDEFSNVVSTQNRLGPGRLPIMLISRLDPNSDYHGNDIDEMIIEDTNIGVGSSHTWPNLNVPYQMGSHYIDGDVVIEAGTTMIFRSSGRMNVQDTGSLKAVGNAAAMITFTAANPTPGYWDGIQYTFSNNVNNELDYAVVEYGGSGANNGDSNLTMYGNGTLVNRIKVSNSIFRYSLGYGVEFSSATAIDAFSNNIITENAIGAARLPANKVGWLDTLSDYSGNSTDIVYVEDGNVDVAQTWPSIGIPYSTGSMNINAHLSIEPGATLIFRSNGRMNVDQDAALTADGTVDAPITFTADQNVPGYWDGIQFTFSFNANNVLNYTIIEYAGAGINQQASVILYGNGTLKPSATITNSIVRSSSSHGIWLSREAEVNLDIDTSNSFSDIAAGYVNVYRAP